ncbi:MAG: hypothetical protein M3Y59_00325 [Myxococcota bacterium]|nr:hypothetical protein [Myxococcota bacterium]
MSDVLVAGMFGFAEALGEALGRGVARGFNAGLGGAGNMIAATPQVRGRGRPPKNLQAAAASGENRCAAQGCTSAARAKGLCSRHYQAERRKQNASS